MTIYQATTNGIPLPNTTSYSASVSFMKAVFHGYGGTLDWIQLPPRSNIIITPKDSMPRPGKFHATNEQQWLWNMMGMTLEPWQKYIFKQLRYGAQLNEDTCGQCSQLHGKIFDLNDPDILVPPMHGSEDPEKECKCVLVPMPMQDKSHQDAFMKMAMRTGERLAQEHAILHEPIKWDAPLKPSTMKEMQERIAEIASEPYVTLKHHIIRYSDGVHMDDLTDEEWIAYVYERITPERWKPE